MKGIDLSQITKILNDKNTGFGYGTDKNGNITTFPKSQEIANHDSFLHSIGIVSNTLNEKDVLQRYEQGSKEVNKLKRVDPNKPIIDAYDIDWSMYSINFNGHIYTPKTTFELLDLIFRLINRLYNINDAEDIIWNDDGDDRTDEHILNWAEDYNETYEDWDRTDNYSSKPWQETSDPDDTPTDIYNTKSE